MAYLFSNFCSKVPGAVGKPYAIALSLIDTSLSNSVANAIQWPTFIASVSLLVPKKEDLPKVNGYTQAANGLSMMLAPMISGWIMSSKKNDSGLDPDTAAYGLGICFLVETVTFVGATLITLASTIPNPPRDKKSGSKDDGVRARIKETFEAWNYLVKQPGLFALLLFLAQAMVSNGAVQILMTPVVLSLYVAA